MKKCMTCGFPIYPTNLCICTVDEKQKFEMERRRRLDIIRNGRVSRSLDDVKSSYTDAELDRLIEERR